MPWLPESPSVRALRSRIVAIARALLGVPDYERYLAHHALHHPDSLLLSRAEFFALRQSARFGRGASRCC